MKILISASRCVRSFLLTAVVAVFVAAAQRGQAAQIRPAAEPVAGKYIVALSPFTTDVPGVAGKLAAQYHGRVLTVWRLAVKGFWIEISAENAARLAKDKRVVSIEEDAQVHSSDSRTTGTPEPGIPGISPKAGAPPDPLWHLTRISHRENSTGHSNSDRTAPNFDANYYRYTSSNTGVAADGRRVTVYLIDTGVMAAHREFGGRLAGQRPRVEEAVTKDGAGLPVAAAITDKSDRVAPDYVPPDFSRTTAPCEERIARGGFELTDKAISAHGTAVASLVNGRYVGVADGAVVVSVNTISCEAPDDTGVSTSAAILISALDWILADAREPDRDVPGLKKLAVVSTSRFHPTVSGPYLITEPNLGIVESAFMAVVNEGIPVVASANNQGADACDMTPSRLSHRGGRQQNGFGVITVGGTEADDRRLDETGVKSNHGQCVDIWAPGSRLSVASVEAKNYRGADIASGTSYSAPIVAGLLARILAAEPTLTVAQAWDRLALNATRLEPGTDSDPLDLKPGSSRLLAYLGAFTFTQQPPALTVVPSGSPVTLSVTILIPAGFAPGAFRYQWYKGDAGTVTTPFATGSTITFNANSDEKYWARVTHDDNPGYAADSNTAEVKIAACVRPQIVQQPLSVWGPVSTTAPVITAALASSPAACYEWQFATDSSPAFTTVEGSRKHTSQGQPQLIANVSAGTTYYRLVAWASDPSCASPANSACEVQSDTAQVRLCDLPTINDFANPLTREIDTRFPTGKTLRSTGQHVLSYTWLWSSTGQSGTFQPLRRDTPPTWRLYHTDTVEPFKAGYYKLRAENACSSATTMNSIQITKVCDYQVAWAQDAGFWLFQTYAPDQQTILVSNPSQTVTLRVQASDPSNPGMPSSRHPLFSWQEGGVQFSTASSYTFVVPAERTITLVATEPETGCVRTSIFVLKPAAQACISVPSFTLLANYCHFYGNGLAQTYSTYTDGRVYLDAYPADLVGMKLTEDFEFVWTLSMSTGAPIPKTGPTLDVPVDQGGRFVDQVTLFAKRKSDSTCTSIDIEVRRNLGSCSGCVLSCSKHRAVRSSGGSLPSVITIDPGEQLVLTPPEEQTGWTYEWHQATSTSGDVQFATSAEVTVAPVINTRFSVVMIKPSGERELSEELQVLVRGAFDGVALPESQAIEAGSIATITASVPDPSFVPDSTTTYEWRSGSDYDLTAPVIPNNNQATLSVVSPADTTSFWCRITDNGHIYDTNVAVVIVTCTPAITGSIQSWPTGLQMGRGELPYLTASGWGKLLSYKWTYRTSPNEAPQDYSFGPAIRPSLHAPVTLFGVIAEDACGTTASFGEVAVYLCAASVTQEPAAAVVTSGTSAQLTVAARPAVDGQPLTFNWYRSSDNTATTSLGQGTPVTVNGQPGSVFTTPVMTSSDSFYATVTSTCGGQDGQGASPHRTFSMPANVTVCSNPVITGQTVTRDITAGQTTSVVVTATGANLSYQWYQGNSGDTTSPIAGAITNSISVTPAQTTNYWCRIQSRGVCTTDSPVTTVRICTTPVISAQPQSRVIFAGSTTTLSVSTTGDTNSEPLHYQWERLESGGWTAIVGATSATYTTPVLNDAATYRVQITVGVCSIMSQEAAISICLWPQVVTPSVPEKQIQYNATATFALDAMSPVADKMVTWYRGASGDTSSLLISGLNLTSYTTPPLTTTTSYWAQFTNNGCISRTTTYTARVCVPKITSQPAGASIAAGQSTTMTVGTDALPGQSFQWYIGAAGTTTSPIAGQTSATLTVTPSATTTYWVRVTGTCNTSADSQAATVTVCNAPVITGTAPTRYIAPGTPASVSVTATGTNLTYQWYTGASGNVTNPIAGAVSTSLNVTPSTSTTYWCRVKSNGLCATDSAAILVDVCAAPTFSTQPQSRMLFSGQSATLTAAASSTTGAVTYQWFQGTSGDPSTPISGATSASVTVSPTTDKSYWVRATSSVCTTNSNTATISMCIWPEVVTPSVPEKLIAYNTTATLTLDPMSPVADRMVTWYRGVSGDRTTLLISSLNMASYTTPALTATTSYWAELTNNGCASRTTTYTARVCVPTITTQPTGGTIQSGQSFTLTAATTPLPGQTFQWYIGTPGTTTTPVSGATSASLTVTPGSTTTYWLRVTGTCGTFVNSTAATVTVCTAPVINSMTPSPVYTQSGTPTTLFVAASGTNLSLQWFIGPSGTTTNPIANSNSASISVNPGATTSYWVRITSNGLCTTNSSAIVVDVCTAPVITTQPQSQTIRAGQSATLTVATSTANSTFQWYLGAPGTTTSPVGTGASINVTPASDSQYWVRVTRGACSTDSAAADITVCGLSASVANVNAASGQSVALSATVSNPRGTLAYWWYRGNSGDTTTLVDSGVGKSSTTVSRTATTNYWVRVTDSACTVDSATATLNICIPTITTQPASPVIASGTSTTLTAAATGAPLAWQWFVGDSGVTTSLISGATSSSYTTPALTATTKYWARITGCTTVNSVTATVTVCTPPSIAAAPSKSVTTIPGNSAWVSVSATGPALSYQWYKGQSGDVSRPISGATAATYNFTLSTTEYYWVRVTNSCGAVDSAAVLYSVTPSITAHPQDTVVLPGNSATLSVTATGTFLTYQWYEGPAGTMTTPMTGATSATFVTPPVTGEKYYWCRVLSGAAGSTSNAALVKPCTGPQIAMFNRSYQGGGQWLLTISVVPEDQGLTKYQWYTGTAGDVAHSTAQGPVTTSYYRYLNNPPSQNWWIRVWYSDDSCYTDTGGLSVP